MLEKIVITGIKERLSVLQLTGQVIYWERLQSGAFRKGGHYIKLSRTGTPDFICVIRNRQDNLSFIFFEAKRPDGKGKLSKEQVSFMKDYSGIKDFYHFVITDPREVGRLIDDLSIDKLQEIK